MENSLFNDLINAQLKNQVETCKTGIAFIDDALGGISPKDFIVVGGKTGFGKTEFCTQIGNNMAQLNTSVALMALEAERNEIHARIHFKELARMYFGEPKESRPKTKHFVNFKNYYKGLLATPEMMALQKLAWHNIESRFENFEISYPTDVTARDMADFIEVDGKDFHAIIIDHLHYLEHPGLNEYDGTIEAIKLIRDRALQEEKPVILVSHIRKRTGGQKGMITLDDLHGSSEISKRATVVILVERGKLGTFSELRKRDINGRLINPNEVTSPTVFHIAKDRHGGAPISYYGVHNFDLQHQKYEDKYLLMERVKDDLETVKNKPWWAKNAITVQPE